MPDRDQHHSQTPAEGPSPEPDRVDVTGDYSGPDPAAPRSVSSPASPPRLSADRYQLLDEIAHGGMGVIWRAIDTTLGREVAVKVLMDKLAPDSGVARRFEAEARITAQLQHPAIPPVHDYGKLPDDRPFLAMKLIKGRTLEELLRQRADPAAERGRFVAVFEQVCQAVAYAHAHRVIHRDLKPGNVMVGSFGEVQVMDWGLAKVLTDKPVPAAADTDAGETVGGTIIHGSDADGSDPSFTQAGSILGTLGPVNN
jgi:eukaryotic-like serine/threonine-protein kinase